MTFNIMNLSFFIILYEPSTSFASSSNGVARLLECNINTRSTGFQS